MSEEQLKQLVPAIVAVSVPVLTWILGFISEYRGGRRLDYFRTRVELYERLIATTKEESLRATLIIAMETEIKAAADYLGNRRATTNISNALQISVRMPIVLVISGALVMLF